MVPRLPLPYINRGFRWSHWILGLALVLWGACRESKKTLAEIHETTKKLINGIPHEDRPLVIRPLGEVKPQYLQWTADILKKTYNLPVKIGKGLALNQDFYYPDSVGKGRLNAPYLLSKFESTTEIPVWITQADLGYDKVMKSTVIQGNTVWGLALQPVDKVSPYTPSALIVSTHRMKRASRKKRLRKRLQKVILHEVGHSLTLSHCQHQKACVMVDFGARKTSIDKVKSSFCAKCRKQIQPYLKANQG